MTYQNLDDDNDGVVDANVDNDQTKTAEFIDGSGTSHTAEIADSVDIRTDEQIQDVVGGLIQANGNISVTYDDANDVLTVDTSALNEEEVEDAVASLITAGNAITVNYDDVNDSLSIAVDESSLSFYDGTNLTANVDNQSVITDETHTKTVGASDYHYAGDYDGTDADARLDNAIAAASSGDVIYLESASYQTDRTISDFLTIIGTTDSSIGDGVAATWTLNEFRVTLLRLRGTSDATIDVQSAGTVIRGGNWGGGTQFNVNAGQTQLTNIRNGDITFASGTSGSIVDSCVNVSVTDNGTNTVGDIA